MKNLNIVVITGLSGSGKSTAIHALEDSGYFCVDNMPIELLPKFLELRSGSASEAQELALGMDLREKEFAEKYMGFFTRLREEGYRLQILFLEASEEVLIKRYSQTRRQHPISAAGGLLESIRAEKVQLPGVRDFADKIIDTSNFTVHHLKEVIVKHVNKGLQTGKMRMGIVSFGFKYGVPLEADLMIDARFIPNPYFISELNQLNGKDPRVRQFVKKWPETQEFLDKYIHLLDYLIPLYEKEGRSYLTLAVGCTGGKHRSVSIAEEIYDHLKNQNRETSLIHRDIERLQ